jgi:hypothetical protein
VAAYGSVPRSDGRRQRAERLEDLKGFRSALFGCATRRADAWFELVDALLATERLVSLPHLSLEPIHRRGHGSLYAALRHGQVQAERLRAVLAAHLPPGPPVFAVDPTVWPRCDAECSPGRGFYYHPSRHSAGQPIVAGWCYQLIVGLELARNSWTAPVDVRRLAPDDNINLVAAGQIRGLLDRLPGAATTTVQAHQQLPLVVFDGGFDPVQLQVQLAGAPVQVLVRIRSDRNFYAAGHPRRDGRPGRPARHGAKLSLADPATWPAPTATWQEADPQYGQVTVTAWGGLHPKQRTYRDADGHLRIVAGTLVRGCPGAPGRPRRCGCGGPAQRGSPRTWRLCGEPMFAASTSSTPSAFGSRPCTGPCPGLARPSRPTGSPGPWRLAMPSCAWPARSSPIFACPGSNRLDPTS